MSWKALITDAGNELSAKTISGGSIKLTHAKAGSGTVSEQDLHLQTELVNVKQTLSIESIKYSNAVNNIEILLDCRGLKEAYDLTQIGIYATDPDAGEILFAIAQTENPKHIPAENEVPFYSIDFNFAFALKNNQSMVATIDQSTFATKEQLSAVDARIDNIIVNAGSTEDNAELIDMRVDVDGKRHSTAGEALRSQLKQKANLTDISSPYQFRGACLSANLPGSGNKINDTYYVTDKKCKFTWNGAAWYQSSLNESDYEEELSSLTEDLVDLESNVIFLDNPKAEYTIQQSALLNTNDGSVNTYNQSAYQITKVNVTNVYEMTILQDVLKNYGVAFFDESGTWLARASLKKGVATTVNVPEGATSAWYNEPNGSVPNVVCATSLPTYNSIKDDVDDIGTEYTNNLFDPSESLVEYGFNPLTGSIGTKAGFMVTNPIAVQSGEVVEVNNPTAVAFGGSIIPSPLYYQTYDRNMFLLATQNTVSNGRVTIAQDGFIRFCFSSGNKYNAKSVSNVTIHKVDGDYKPYVKFGYDLPKLNILKDNITPMTYNWYGKKWVSVGDSNTSRRQYQKYVVDALGLQWANVAEGGKRVQYFATDEKIAEIIAQNPDVITIMLGTNNTSESGIGSLPPYPSNDMEIIDTSYDWSQQTYKETYVRLDSNGNPVKDASGNIIYDTVNEMTYASAMMTIVSKIQTALPYCIIILMSPMYGSIVGNGRPKEVYTAGAYKQEAILKEISERFGCEYINVQNLMSMYNCNPYFDDEEDGSKQWTHWNEKAGKKLAQRIIMTMLYNEPIEKISYR